jgi:hypothetical protein
VPSDVEIPERTGDLDTDKGHSGGTPRRRGCRASRYPMQYAGVPCAFWRFGTGFRRHKSSRRTSPALVPPPPGRGGDYSVVAYRLSQGRSVEAVA